MTKGMFVEHLGILLTHGSRGIASCTYLDEGTEGEFVVIKYKNKDKMKTLEVTDEGMIEIASDIIGAVL